MNLFRLLVESGARFERQIGTGIACVVIVTALPLSLLLAAAPMPLLSQEPLPPPSASPQYVGAEMCAICHEDISIDLRSNPHSDQQIRIDGTDHGACETCHGPGLEHADTMDRTKIRAFADIGPIRTAAVCLDCHAGEGSHSDRLFDTHQRKSVTCTSCHDIHAPTEPRYLLVRTANKLCSGCHPAERAEFGKPFSHRLQEGAMSCVDCHAPHGSPAPRQLRMTHSNQESCFACHGDKRGPFAFGHMPAGIGGCASCHETHGSSNPRMLVRHEVRLVCLECHSGSANTFGRSAPAFHDLRSSRIRNCTLCHSKIHGSNLHRAFLR